MKEDKRTKNLTLRDIHVGDWVQVWFETAERYSSPLKIIQISDNGTIHLVGSEEERWAPWKENIKNVDALPITRELLKGFGFEITIKCMEGEYNVFYDEVEIGEFCEYSNCNVFETTWSSYEYLNELMDYMYDIFPRIRNFEWKGGEK